MIASEAILIPVMGLEDTTHRWPEERHFSSTRGRSDQELGSPTTRRDRLERQRWQTDCSRGFSWFGLLVS